jgi:hypothetical protein
MHMATTAIGVDRQSGSAMERYPDAVFMRDNAPFYFGNDGDAKLLYSTAASKLAITGVGLSWGTSGTHLSYAAAGTELLSIFADVSVSLGGRSTTLRIESLLNTADAFTAQGSGLYTIRGLAGVKASSTFKGSANQGYIAGVQGKLYLAGALGDGNSGGIYSCAVLAQIQTTGAATFGADAQVYGLWVDNQAGGVNLPATSHLVNITNNGGTVTNFFKLYGGNQVSYLMDIDTVGGINTTISNHTTMTKALKIKLEGATCYIPVMTGTT